MGLISRVSSRTYRNIKKTMSNQKTRDPRKNSRDPRKVQKAPVLGQSNRDRDSNHSNSNRTIKKPISQACYETISDTNKCEINNCTLVKVDKFNDLIKLIYFDEINKVYLYGYKKSLRDKFQCIECPSLYDEKRALE